MLFDILGSRGSVKLDAPLALTAVLRDLPGVYMVAAPTTTDLESSFFLLT